MGVAASKIPIETKREMLDRIRDHLGSDSFDSLVGRLGEDGLLDMAMKQYEARVEKKGKMKEKLGLLSFFGGGAAIAAAFGWAGGSHAAGFGFWLWWVGWTIFLLSPKEKALCLAGSVVGGIAGLVIGAISGATSQKLGIGPGMLAGGATGALLPGLYICVRYGLWPIW